MNIRIVVYLLLLVLSGVESVSAAEYKIACVGDYYPYTYINKSGEVEGVIADWWKLWAKKTNSTVVFVPSDYNDCIKKVLDKEVDAMAGAFYDETHSNSLTYSDAIIRMRTILFLSNKIKVDSISHIISEIGLVENDILNRYLNANYPKLKKKVFISYFDLRNALYANNIDGFIYDYPNPIIKVKDLTAPKGYYKFKVLFSDNLRPVIIKGNESFAKLLIEGTNAMTNEELLDIVKDWKLFKKDNTLLYAIAILVILLFSVIVYFVLYVKNRKTNQLLNKLNQSTDWQVIINKGENDLIEFKSSLRWDYRQDKMNKILELVIVKTVSAFLNTQGGMLFIGVDDDGNILGLDNDYNCMSKKNRDGFLLTITNVINQNIGKKSHRHISINIISINERDVCIVNMEKSDSPVFIKKGDKEEFYIRASASSQPLGMSESYEYIKSHWE